MSRIIKDEFAPAGTTGNNVHKSVTVAPHGDQYAVQVHVESVGAGPTATFAVEGSLDDNDVSDADSHWFVMALQPSDAGAAVDSFTMTAPGTKVYFVNTANRFAAKLRLVTTLNTNVTYHAHIAVRDVH